MRYFLFLLAFGFSLSVFAQDYEKQWNKVYAFELDGKTKSASEEVDKIYKKAKKGKNDEQIIKAFLYQSKFILSLQEGGQQKVIQNLQHEIKNSSEPNTSILNYIYAKSLNDYYQKYKYRLKDRTKTEQLPDDFTLWSRNDFESEIEKIFEKSIENRQILVKTSLKKYKELIEFGRFGKNTNRTLYDFLVFEYINAIKNHEYVYATNNPKTDAYLYSGIQFSDIFTKIDFSEIENTKVIKLYQKLESHYLSTNQQENLERVWLNRLDFFMNKNLYKDSLLQAYQNFSEKSKFPYYKYDAVFKQAKIYRDLAHKEKCPDCNIKAVALLDTLIKNRKKSDAFLDGENLRKSIYSQDISIQANKVLYYGENSRLNLSFRNVDTLFGYFYKIDDKLGLNKSTRRDKLNDSIVISLLKNEKPVKSFQEILPQKKDYFSYSTEVLLPKLDRGTYVLIVGDKLKDINRDDFSYGYSLIYVSDITLNNALIDGMNHFRVLHKKTGNPIQGAEVCFDSVVKFTDKLGQVFFELKQDNKARHQKKIEVKYQDNYYSEVFYDYSYKKTDKKNQEWKASVEIYSDRAIYRPGQTLYYKGIVYQNKNGENSVVPNIYVNLEISDDNYQTLETRRVKTNEFGSFSGEYLIPKNIITGDLKIDVSEDEENSYQTDEIYDKEKDEHPFWDNVDEFKEESIYLRVEEYKRPTFEVVFDKEIDNYVLNDSIVIKGKVKSFSNAIISDAKVKFTLERDINYSKNNFRGYFFNSEQIDSGEIQTDNQGNFEIKFKAIPSLEIKKEVLPVFSYRINADVTDKQGETQNANHTIQLGYHNLSIDMRFPAKQNTKNPLEIILISTNLNNKSVTTDLTLKIFKKPIPKKILKSRAFEKPEIQMISKTDFENLFPYEPYENPELTEKELLYSKTVNTENQTKIVVDNIKNWKSGEYQIEISAKDVFSDSIITTIKDITLINHTDVFPSDNNLIEFVRINEDVKKDGVAKYKLTKSIPDDIFVFIDAYQDGKSIYSKQVKLDKSSLFFDVPIQTDTKTESHIEVHSHFVWENDTYVNSDRISIAVEQPFIQAEIVSMKNKLEPNSNQTWSFVIKNEKGKGKQAEVLASMYDMSLDSFDTKNWLGIKELEPYNYNYHSYYSRSYPYESIGFFNVYFKNYTYQTHFRNTENDQFNRFGYNFTDFKIDKKYYQFLETKKENKEEFRRIKGVVTSSNDGLPLPGATILIEGTNVGTQSDLNGNYEIYAKIGDVLVISFLGMESTKFIIESKEMIDNEIKMNEDYMIETINIDSYRKITRKTAFASAVLVNSTTLEARANAGPLQTLQGQVSGLEISAGSGQPGSAPTIIIRGTSSKSEKDDPLFVIDGVPLSGKQFRELHPDDIADLQILKDAAATSMYGNRGANGVIIITTKKGLEELSKVQTRQNLKETAFFYPHLTTDKNGNLSFNFTSPEALTSWKFRMLSHTKEALSGYFESVVTTQKDLMIEPNMPRFVRETDTIIIKAKVSNLSNEIQNGMAMLQLTNINDNSNININDNVKSFKINPKGSETLSWKVVIPKGTQGLEYKITAKTGNFTDGEQSIIPVLPNRILVNESIPIWVRENSKKDFVFENLKNNDSKTLEHNSFTLEYTSNPTWIAIGSLPYLMEYEHECSEQIFSKLYANSVASHILESNPKVKDVFAKWSENPTSKLEQNEELKNILLSETPWIRNSQSEEEQKKNLALLMDLQKSKSKSEEILKKLEGLQKSNGSFGWFEGSPENTFITTHIATGFGHLKKLGIDIKSDEISKKAINYLDKNFEEKTNSNIQNRMIIRPYNELHYLYARSFYPEITPKDSLKLKIDKAINQYKEKWLTLSLYEKGMLALVLHRNSDTKTAKKIIEHFKESAVINTDFGMYWLENVNSPYWYKAPIETQALLIEAFSEISPNDKNIEELKVWLIKQKQTKHWSTTKSTTLAVNALLLGKKDFVSLKDKTTFSIGKNKIKTNDDVSLSLSKSQKESETGYVKLSWKADQITKDFAEVSIENKSESVGFGGLYWSYFEELDNIKKSYSDLFTIQKELYLKKPTKEGSELVKITSDTKLKLGDLVTVRLVLKANEEMDFVHLKDMRASGFEPVDVLSKYEYKDGISYYKSTKDVATHFFFDSINKGTYVLEYDVRVNNLGSFSNGITTLQSMYAPEYSSHTGSVRVITED